MPTATEILRGLASIANDAFALAVIWHVVIAVALIAVIAGWRPSNRLAASLLATPLASVSALAWAHGNPFNGAVLGAVAIGLLVLAQRAAAGPVRSGSLSATAIGVAMIAFGWSYPHFLEGRSPVAYLYGAPTGLVPCPTLSVTIGVALLAGGLGARAWSGLLGVTGLFYAAFGALRLGVHIDLALLVGALALLVVAAPRVSARSGRDERRPPVLRGQAARRG